VGATGCVNRAGAALGVDDAGSVIPPRRQGSDIETQSKLAFAEPTAAQGYPEFFARVVAYVGRDLWAIVRENAVPLSGNLVIIMIFALGVFRALRLVLWIMRKLWPVLLALAGLGVARYSSARGCTTSETLASPLTIRGLVLSS